MEEAYRLPFHKYEIKTREIMDYRSDFSRFLFAHLFFQFWRVRGFYLGTHGNQSGELFS